MIFREEYIILVSLLLFLFFSGLKITFITSFDSYSRFKEKNRKKWIRFLLNHHSRPFFIVLFWAYGISFITFTISIVYYLNCHVEWSGFVHYFLFQLIIIGTGIILIKEGLAVIIAKVIPEGLYLKLFFPVYILFYPLIKAVAWIYPAFSAIIVSGEWFSVSRLFGLKNSDREEIHTGIRFFRNALDFSQIKLKDCMIPRTEIVAVEFYASEEELLSKFIETGFSKIIIYKNNIDNIVGYIHVSAMFSYSSDRSEKIHSLSAVPQNMTAEKLLKNMLNDKKSMVIAVDEFGGTSGLLTMEDLVEEILGEIEDEYDKKMYVAKKESDTEYVLSGRIEVSRANQLFGLEIPESDEYVTISGFILSCYRHFPSMNEVIDIGIYSFKIIKVTAKKIELVKLLINK